MKFNPTLRLLLLVLSLVPALRAQTTFIWANGTGTWDTTTANWSGSVWLDGNNATIGATTARTGTVTIQPVGVTVNNVTSGSGGGAVYGYVLTGGAITLAGPTSAWSTGGPSGSQLLVESVVTGSGALEKIGTRALVFAADNTYTGGTTITAGTLQLGNGGSTGSVTGNIVNNAGLVFNRADSYVFNGLISGTGSVTQQGSGTLVFAEDNTATGTTTVTSGTLQLGNGGATGSVAGNITNNAALTFNRSAPLTYAGIISGTGTVTVAGTGALQLTGAHLYTGATTIASGATLGGSGSLTSAVTVQNGGTLAAQSGQLFTVAGLTFAPDSRFDVALGVPSSTGLVLVNGNLTLDGTLNLTAPGGFGPGLYRLIDYTGTLTDNGMVFGQTAGLGSSYFALQTSVANQINLLFDAGPANLWRGGPGTWSASAGGSGWTDLVGTINQAWQPQFAIFSGTPGAVTVDTAAGVVVLTGAQFAADGYTISGGVLTNNTPAAVFRVGNGTAGGAAMTATISSAIAGTGGLDKTDLGTLVLSGNNSYAGATTVSNGLLRVNGNQAAATGAVTVRNGATLGGSGTLGGTVTIENGGTLAGQSGATLTMNGLVLNGTSNVNVALGAPSATRLFQVNGNLTLDGILNATDAGGFGPGVYRLFDYTGTLTNNGLAFGTMPVSSQFLAVQTSQANQVNLIFDAGPRNFWSGGSATWSASPASTAWTDFTGSAAAPWQPEFAIFQNAAGTVTVDTAAGAVVLTGAQFARTGYTVTGGTLTNNTASAVFRVGDGTAAGAGMTATINSVIAGTGGLNKTDLGTLVLGGANTYSGATTVSAGTLRVNGNQAAATGAVTVQSGATLAGTGTLGGTVTVANGGTLAGQSGATLTMGGLVLSDSANVNVTLGAPSASTLFQVNGNLTLDGILNITGTAGFGQGLYRLFNYTGALTNNTLALGTTSGVVANSFSVVTSTANQVSLLYRDLSVALPIWTGGSGTWSADPDAGGFRDENNTTSGGWRSGFAIFGGTAGTVTVNTAAGAVEISGLQFASNGYTVTGGTLTNNTAAATFRVGDGTTAGTGMTGTINSVIAGTGGVNKTDLGTLVLGGANTYSGGTTVSSGVLQVSADANLGAISGALTLNGGTLRSGASFASTRAVTLGASGGTLDTAANTLTLSGALAGTGALTKTGSGTLVLAGTNTYTGATALSAGTLLLQNSSVSATTIGTGATLAGTGTVRGNLVNNGRVSPGSSPGTITVNGNYTQSAGGTYAAELASASSYDRLVVNGSAALNGTLSLTALNSYTPAAGQVHTLLTATGGVTGTFATVSTPWDQLSAMLRPVVTYTSADVRFALTQSAFASLAGTPNQQAIGAALDGSITANSAPTVVAALNALPTQAAVLAALDELSPQRYEPWFGQSVVHANASVRSAERRLAGVAGNQASGLWMELARRETSFDATGDSRAAEGSVNGLLVGGDVAITPDFQLGAVFSYGDETLELDAAGSRTEAPRYGVAIYARQQFGGGFLDVVGGFSSASLTSTRIIAIPGFNSIATLENDSFESHVAMRLGYGFTMGGMRVTPYAGAQFVRWQANGADETGAGAASLALLTQSAKSLVARAGVNLAGKLSVGGVELQPELDLAWRNELEDDARSIVGEFGGTPFSLRTRQPTRGALAASLGLGAAFGENFGGHLGITLERDGATDEAIEAAARLTYRF